VHWNSGQEIVFRVTAWLFGLHVFGHLGCHPPLELEASIYRHLQFCYIHLSNNIEYARDSVYNNHLLSEALGLYVLGSVLDRLRPADNEGFEILSEQAGLQVYPDGSYIQQSHNYHRVALQDYLWALSFARVMGHEHPPSWTRAVADSLDFLLAQQNPEDGRLPNFGCNDGSLPMALSTCDFSDFRPTLQAASIAVRRERIYAPGPWDEMAVWLLGPDALGLPFRGPQRKSVSFTHSGYHVLRGREAASFSVFRCGSLLERFSQIDMLHVDVWWRGHNVLVDGGSYLYNGPEAWHNHFHRTRSHNTIQVDRHDQTIHFRRFKNLYWTQAKLLRFEEAGEWTLVEGEHYGYRRFPNPCVHRRSVLFAKDDIWIVVDRVSGPGKHEVRLHWLGGDYPYRTDESGSSLHLSTPAGLFSVSVFDEFGHPLRCDVVAGSDNPPRGWLSRYYAEKTPVPSLVVERRGGLPMRTISVLCAGAPTVDVSGSKWTVSAGATTVEFILPDTCMDPAGIRVFQTASSSKA
jgi:asparagine synthase (glutamine-hydrolysing)